MNQDAGFAMRKGIIYNLNLFEMLNVKIDKETFQYLLESDLNTEIKDILQANCIKSYDLIDLYIEKNIAIDILDFLGNELCQKGFKEDDQPNDAGIIIENIIDKFSRKVYEE